MWSSAGGVGTVGGTHRIDLENFFFFDLAMCAPHVVFSPSVLLLRRRLELMRAGGKWKPDLV